MFQSKWILCITFVALFCLLLAVPAFAAQSNAVISAGELNGFVDSEGVVIIDVRAADAYGAGHIPGAVSVQTSEFFEELAGVKQMAAGPEKFSALLSKTGVAEESQVVIYSAGNDFKHAARLWWTFHIYGHQNAQLLDGGFDTWVAAGYDVSTDPVTPAASVYTLTAEDVNQDAVATTDEVKSALGTDTVIIDCRDENYYQGKNIRPRAAGT